MSNSNSVISSNSSKLGQLHSDMIRNCKRDDHFLNKLFRREVGLSQVNPEFPYFPDRLKFPLLKTLPTSSLSSHVFLGVSKCGQFLITYTYTTEVDDRMMGFNSIYKYRLHWWAFVPYARARKVAEVTLFGNTNVYNPLYLAVCQWPTDSTKIVVYGNCSETYVGLVGQTERSYVTITAVPSLHNCMECQKVAASFEEEDIAASWDSCVRFSCLVHGLTVHTSFDVAPPYPKFHPKISMKCDGRVVLNTGNFLHIIGVDLENSFKTAKTSRYLDSCQPQIEHSSSRTKTVATSNVNVRMNEYQTLLGIAPPSPFASSSDHTSCDGRSLVEELNITCQAYVSSSNVNMCCRPDLLMLETDSDGSSQISTILSPPLKRRGYHLLSPNTSPRGQQGRLNVKLDAGKAYEFPGNEDYIYETLSSFRKRRLADKKYEFSEEDFEDSENIVPFRVIRNSDNSVIEAQSHFLSSSSITYPKSNSKSTGNIGDPPDIIPIYRRKSGAGTDGTSANVDAESSSTPIYVDLPLDQDKVVLRPHNRNHALLSPREQETQRESNKKSLLMHMENNAASLSSVTLSTPSYTGRNIHGFPVSRSSTVRPVSSSSNASAAVANANVNKIECDGGWCKGGCTVQFERRFIEVDDELVSVITDIEDDDESGSTGYHSALPLEVHGSGYVQMQMISNSKAEKLMAPCALVHQMSFDIEQFCHEVAETLCEQSGMKFWCCNNYDVEVVDVCSISGDVVCLAFMKIKATVKGKEERRCDCERSGERQQYETSILLLWNMYTGLYRLDKSSPLEKLESTSSCDDILSKDYCHQPGSPQSVESVDDWNPARKVACELRIESNCKVTNHPPVRVSSNTPIIRGFSLSEIKDDENWISFIL